MKKENIFMAAFFLAIAIFLTSNVNAFWISPAITNLDFEPSETYGGSFTLYNHGGSQIGVSLLAFGELAGYIEIPNQITIKPDSQEVVNYKLSLPASMEYGFHKAEIMAVENTPQSEGETVIGAKIAVVTQIKVLVPYPEKYVNAEIMVDEKEEEIWFMISLANIGNADIENAYASIAIEDQTRLIERITTNSVNIAVKDKNMIHAVSKQNLQPGDYKATATVNYDGKENVVARDFQIKKERLILLKEFSVQNSEETPVRFDVTIENLANKEMKDVVLDLSIIDASQNVVENLKSAPLDLKPKEQISIPMYWDYQVTGDEVYKANLMINGMGYSLEKSIEFGARGLITSGINEPVISVKEPDKSLSNNWFFGIGGILFIIIISAVLIYKKRSFNKDKVYK